MGLSWRPSVRARVRVSTHSNMNSSEHYVNVSVLIKFSQKYNIIEVILPYLPSVLHKIICCGCVLESPRRGDSNTHPQHMILWRNIANYNFFIILIPTPDFPHFYYMLGGNLG